MMRNFLDNASAILMQKEEPKPSTNIECPGQDISSKFERRSLTLTAKPVDGPMFSDTYIDSNLDWSFASLTPQMVKILTNDHAAYVKKKSHESDESIKGQLARSLNFTMRKLSGTKNFRLSMVGTTISQLNLTLAEVNDWHFNIFEANQAIGYHVMYPVAKRIFTHYDLLNKFRIPETVFAEFISKVERHYRHNPFHNSVHATDVMQTVHSIMLNSGFVKLMNDLEILCILITALVHDIEHTGTNNNYHRNARSEMAKLYMVSILENHHLRVALGILRMIDVLASLSEPEFEEFKEMLCSMILSTDMGNHFLLITNMKIILHTPTKMSSRLRIRRIMLLLLHSADISNPAKPWDIHKIWVSLLCQEFFEQGDKEKKMNLPVSPNCDKNTANIAALQLGFMQMFGRETFEVLYTLMEKDITDAGETFNAYYPWLECMNENAENWNKNWSSLKYAFINDLLTETASPRKSVMGESKRVRSKKWKCCLCPCCVSKRTRRLYNLQDYSSATLTTAT